MSLRLKYAGIDTRIIKYEADMRKALREGLSSLPAGGRLQVLLSYTALQGFRRMVNQFNPQKQNLEHPGFK